MLAIWRQPFFRFFLVACCPAPVFLLFFIFFSAQSAGKGEKETMNRIFRWNQRQGPLHLLVVSTQLTSAQAHGLGVTRSSKIEESKDCCNLCTLVVATLLRCGILTLFFFLFFFFFAFSYFLGSLIAKKWETWEMFNLAWSYQKKKSQK